VALPERIERGRAMTITHTMTEPPAPLPRSVRLLLAARLARSIGQGVLAVDFALYLRSLGWSGAAIGSLLAAGLAYAVVLTIAAAMPSDRFGRKKFLIGYDAMYAVACLAAIASKAPAVLVVAGIVGGFGRGANGSAGPFAAIEMAWITQGLDAPTWSRVLNLNASFGFLGMAAGAALGALPGFVAHTAAGTPAYGLIFPIALLAALVCLVLIAMAKDQHAELSEPIAAPVEQVVRQTENRNLRKLGLVNLLQGAGIGLAGPLVSYWFAIRFGIGPRHIAPLMAAGFLLAAASSQLTAPFTRKYGLMPVIVRLRLAALLLLVAMPLAPTLPLAMAIFLLRSTLNRATNAPRAAITANLVRNKRRGFAGMVSTVSRQIPRSIGPVVAGALFDSGALAAPFLIGALLQGGYLFLYQKNFRDKDPLARRAAVPETG
jgi:MFS family permease